LFLVW